MNRKRLLGGMILIFVGLLLLGRSLDLFDFDFKDMMRFLLPAALIVLGAWFIFRKRSPENANPGVGDASFTASPTGETEAPFGDKLASQVSAAGEQFAKEVNTLGETINRDLNDLHVSPPPHVSHPETPGQTHRESARPNDSSSTAGSGQVRYSRVLGDLYIDCRDMQIKNVEASSFIGDVEIRLTGAQLAPGLNRLIISQFLGDVRIIIPKEFAYFVHASSVIGDVETLSRKSSGVSNRVEQASPGYDSAKSKLYIAVNSFLGDIHVIPV